MIFFEETMNILSILKNQLPQTGDFLVQSDQDTFIFQLNNKPIFKIDNKTVQLLNTDITKVFTESDPETKITDPKNFENLLRDLKTSFVKLNHLGISYFCPNIEQEVQLIKDQLANTGLTLYEEPNELTDQKWLFIVDDNSKKDPLFEIVLSENHNPFLMHWAPHFQIDLDTDLDISQLKKLAEKHLEKNFFEWEMNAPDIGTFLVMGILSNFNGTKHCLGLGTDIRYYESYRENTFKKL